MVSTLEIVRDLGIQWECCLLGRINIPGANVLSFVITLYQRHTLLFPGNDWKKFAGFVRNLPFAKEEIIIIIIIL